MSWSEIAVGVKLQRMMKKMMTMMPLHLLPVKQQQKASLPLLHQV